MSEGSEEDEPNLFGEFVARSRKLINYYGLFRAINEND